MRHRNTDKSRPNKVTTRKPTVSIIGPGRLGIAMGKALHSVGYQIVSLIGRRPKELQKAAALLDVSCEILAAKDLHKYKPSDLVIVAVPDDRIAQVAEALDGVEISHHPTILHTSGALSSRVFANLKKKGWHTGSLHPLASISEPVAGAALLRKAFWCIEGGSAAVRMSRRVVRDLGGQSFSIDSKDKPLYHAAAVMSSGNVTVLFDVALQMLERCGLSRGKARRVLLPLLESTVVNLACLDPNQALTGPFGRGDLATVKMHLSALSQKDLDEALRLYRLLGEHALNLAQKNLASDVVQEILQNLRNR